MCRAATAGGFESFVGEAVNSTVDRAAVPVAEAIESRLFFSGTPHVPVGVPATPIASPTPGLTGTYYQGDQFKKAAASEVDPNIDFYWAQKAPVSSMKAGAFAAQWTGQLIAPTSETYTFTTVADDGVQVWIGGKLIINDWHEHAATVNRGRIQLEAGKTYDVVIKYFECSIPPALIHLYWATPTMKAQIVPESALQTVSTSVSTSTSAPTEGGIPDAPPQPPAISAPASLTATAAGPNDIQLNWSDVTGETGFIVQRSTDGTDGWTGIATIAPGQIEFKDTGLTASTTYYYRIVATNALSDSAPSNVASATTDGLVYGLTNNGEALAIDVNTGQTTQIGTLAFGTAAADRDPLTGNVYYFDQNTDTPRVAVWNPTTNTNTTLATLSLPGPVMRAAFNAQGVLYITAGNAAIYTINTTTGAATYVGTLTCNASPIIDPGGDMAFGPDGTLYIEDEGTLYAANLSTMTATSIGSDGAVGNVQIAFGSDGLFYGTASTGDLYRIDLTTGAATLIGDTGVYQIGDLAPTWG